MTPFLEFVVLLSILLFFAKLAGYLATRLGQPSVLGELIVGLLLGPSVLNLTQFSFIHDPHFINEMIIELGELGVLMLMFLAGLELNLSDLARNTRVSAYAGVLGVVIPVLLGLGVGEIFQMPFSHAVFLGLTLGATSVSISAQTLIEMKLLRSRVGLGLLGAAVFDDVLVILLLSIFLAVTGEGSGAGQIAWVFLRMILFFALSAGFGLYLLPRLTKIVAKMGISQGALTFAIVILLLYGLAAELIGGMAAITGTFIAGLMFSRTSEKAKIETGLHALSYGLLVPIFFISIGLSINLRQLEAGAFWLILLVSVVAVVGKIFGAGLGAYLARYSLRESYQLGAGMVSRGEVGLIVSSIGLKAGLMDNRAFSAVIVMILITTLITPPLLRSAFNLKPAAKPVNSETNPN